jgi:hypothetical protein
MRADKLAEKYEVGTYPSDFFRYIEDSFYNGNKQQVISLFNEMFRGDQVIFLTEYCELELVKNLIIRNLL